MTNSWKPHFSSTSCPCQVILDHPLGAGRGGIRCPEPIQADAAANGLGVVDTVTDGNCGLDAFWTSSMGIKRLAGKQSAPWTSWKKAATPDARFALMRKHACDWVDTNAAKQLWEDFSIGDLARVITNKSLKDYLSDMRRAGTWVDTCFLHCLACSVAVDVLVYQQHGCLTLLGLSLMGETTGAELVPVALVNEQHFWALKPLGAPPCSIVPKEKCLGDEDCEDATSLDMEANVTGGLTAGTELALCEVLGRWKPFEVPSMEVIEAAGRAAAANNPVRSPAIGTLLTARAFAILQLEREHSSDQVTWCDLVSYGTTCFKS